MAKRRKSSQASQVIGDHPTELEMEGLSLFLKLGPVLREWEEVVDRYLEGDKKTLLEIGGRLAERRGLSSADFRRQVICYEEAESGKREITGEEAPEESLRFHLHMEIQTGLAEAFDFRQHLSAKEIEAVPPSPLPAAFQFRRWKPIGEVLLPLEKLDEAETKRFLSDSQWKASQDLLDSARRYEAALRQAKRQLEKEGYKFKDDGTIQLPSSGGSPPKYVNRVVERLYEFLRHVANVHGNTRPVQRDIQVLLKPLIEVDLETIRWTTDNFRRKSTLSSSNSA